MATWMGMDSVEASGNNKRLAGDPRRIGGREERGQARNVLRLPDAAERRRSFDLLAHVAYRDASRVRALRLDHAGVDRVDADSARAEFLRERTGDRIHRSLGAAVNR